MAIGRAFDSGWPTRSAERSTRSGSRNGQPRSRNARSRSDSKLWALELAIRCCDLTTLEGSDTPGKIRQLASKAMRPAPARPIDPSRRRVVHLPASRHGRGPALLRGLGVHLASVATSFPSGQAPLDMRLEEIRRAVADGADEIDIVISRGAFLAGEDADVFDEVAESKEAAGDAHVKAILEAGELGSYDRVRRASLIAMAAGARLDQDLDGKDRRLPPHSRSHS